MWNAEQEHTVGSLVERCYRRMIVFVCLDCLDQALCCYLALRLHAFWSATYMREYDPPKAMRDEEERPPSKLGVGC